MTFSNWTTGTDTVRVNGSSSADTITSGDNVSARILAGAGDDTLVYNGTTVAAAARYDGSDGTDTLQLTTSGDLSGAGSNGVDGFINIEGIRFVDTSGTIIATFSAAQFAAGTISTTSTITGDTRTRALIVNLASGESLDLSGLSWIGSPSPAEAPIQSKSTARRGERRSSARVVAIRKPTPGLIRSFGSAL